MCQQLMDGIARNSVQTFMVFVNFCGPLTFPAAPSSNQNLNFFSTYLCLKCRMEVTLSVHHYITIHFKFGFPFQLFCNLIVSTVYDMIKYLQCMAELSIYCLLIYTVNQCLYSICFNIRKIGHIQSIFAQNTVHSWRQMTTYWHLLQNIVLT